jgi:uncharacterized membrane protein
VAIRRFGLSRLPVARTSHPDKNGFFDFSRGLAASGSRERPGRNTHLTTELSHTSVVRGSIFRLIWYETTEFGGTSQAELIRGRPSDTSIALGVEAAAVLIIAYGAIEGVYGAVRAITIRRSAAQRKEVWLNFGVWLLLGLEFELAADIVRTAVSPTWTDIGQLAAIGIIRTFLNYFLEKDLEKYEPKRSEIGTAETQSAAA